MRTITRNTSKSKSGLFLLELIIAIVFFALSSVVCIRLFVRAHILSNRSSELNMAVIACQNAAESFKAAGGDPEKFGELIGSDFLVMDGENNYSQASYTLNYDASWNRVNDEESAYSLIASVTAEDHLASATITVYNAKGEIIYQLTPKSFTGEGAAQ